MADPKNPENTRPFTPRPNPLTDKTAPMATGGSEVTRPTMSVTRPTVVPSKETTRPVSPVGKSTTSTRTPVVKSPTSTRTPALRRTGTSPAVRPELMTDGMRARRREIERKKRRAALERMRLDAELSEGWRRVLKTAGLVLLVLSLFYGYWRVQQAYGDRWPLMLVWLTMAFFILTGFGWILWYMNKGDV
jgi:hypothetical protein